jgi:hypothetical protein
VDIEAYIPQSQEAESDPEAVPGAPSGSSRDTPKGTGKGGKGGKGDSSARSTPAGTARKTLDAKVAQTAPSAHVVPAAKAVREGSAGLATKDVKVDMDKDKEPPLSPSGIFCQHVMSCVEKAISIVSLRTMLADLACILQVLT